MVRKPAESTRKQRETLVCTTTGTVANPNGSGTFDFFAGHEVWSDDPIVPILRRAFGRDDIFVSKDVPRSTWPNWQATALEGAA